MRIKNQDQRDRFFGWMDGFMDAAEELPDGAWQAFGEYAVKVYNKTHGTTYDPYDAWLYWTEKAPH